MVRKEIPTQNIPHPPVSGFTVQGDEKLFCLPWCVNEVSFLDRLGMLLLSGTFRSLLPLDGAFPRPVRVPVLTDGPGTS